MRVEGRPRSRRVSASPELAVVLEVAGQHVAHRLGRQHQVHEAGVDGAAGHAVELRRSSSWAITRPPASWMARIPREPSLPVPDRMIADGPRAGVLGQRAQERVDGQEQALARVALGEVQPAVGDHHLVPGRHAGRRGRARPACRPRPRATLSGGVRRQQLAHEALEVGREVLDHHEGQRARRPRRGEQPLQRFEASGRGAHADRRRGVCRYPSRQSHPC